MAIATIAGIAVAGSPGIAALIGLIFTFQSVQATNTQLKIAEQGQITDRYNAAIANLGSANIEVRLGGIYALQRLMQDSPRDQPTVVAVLCAFVRDQTASIAVKSQEVPMYRLPTDIQAVLTLVGSRNTANDGQTTVVDFDHARLSNAQVQSLHLSGADFSSAILTSAFLDNASLKKADLDGAILTEADFSGANLTDASLDGADLIGTELAGANLDGVTVYDANLDGASLAGANLTGANLEGVTLEDVTLGSQLVGSAKLTGADLTGAEWSKGVAAPDGWVRDPRTPIRTPTGPPLACVPALASQMPSSGRPPCHALDSSAQ